jgi:hypothetical protein
MSPLNLSSKPLIRFTPCDVAEPHATLINLPTPSALFRERGSLYLKPGRVNIAPLAAFHMFFKDTDQNHKVLITKQLNGAESSF